MQSGRQLRDAIIDDLLRNVFYMVSVPKCFKQDNSIIWLVVIYSSAIKDVSTEVEGYTALKAVTRQRLLKTQQTEKISYCRVCDLALALELFLVTLCKSSINQIFNPNLVCSHSIQVFTIIWPGALRTFKFINSPCRLRV
jgi:hypothetical protein